MRRMASCLNTRLWLWAKTSSPDLSASVLPTVIGPDCRQEIEELDGFSNQLPLPSRPQTLRSK
jgi:hypothetical protein